MDFIKLIMEDPQIKTLSDKEVAEKETERIQRLRLQRIIENRRNEAQERRLEGEWELGPDCPYVGLKAHALLDWLVSNNDVEVITNEDRGEIARIENEIQRLQTEYDNDENVRQDLLDEISELEDSLEELKTKIDVYNIVPIGEHYDATLFEVIDEPNLENNRYAVGDEDEMRSSAYEYVEELIDDIGYRGFNENFVKNYIDDDAVISYAEDFVDEDVRENPDSFINEDKRMLSDDQEDSIKLLRFRISKVESMINRFESEMDGENDDDLQERIDEMNEVIEEMNGEITDIESDPEGDFPEDEIENAIKNRLYDIKRDVTGFMEEYGLNWEDYINREEFINGVIDEDGYGVTLSRYDGNVDETKVRDQWFYVMRID
jgi:hypothetical protein